MQKVVAKSVSEAGKKISKMYETSDVCMGELLSDIQIEGLSVEDQYELFTQLLNWSDGDVFERHEEDELE